MKPLSRIDEPPIRVKHADLTKSGGSPYRSKCPVCGTGVLLVYRDREKFELQAEDRCVFCGQAFVYEDIEALRATERA